MTAIAPSVAEVVQYAGGWLFDQAMAGWDVTVVTAEGGRPLPLDILGVRARSFDAVFAAPALRPCLTAIALRAELYRQDERVRRLLQSAAGAGRAEIRLWGDACPGDFDFDAGPVSHRLSLAARAFKAQALAAAGLPGAATADGLPGAQVSETEVFRRGELGRPRLAAVSLTNA